mmetsp:Transcript_58704/g.179040  ORF Transcript_58704/g.179040 Transcript_58704/m.179040 type:complete len:381 (-) Transcript_58704:478-1620(-)
MRNCASLPVLRQCSGMELHRNVPESPCDICHTPWSFEHSCITSFWCVIATKQNVGRPARRNSPACDGGGSGGGGVAPTAAPTSSAPHFGCAHGAVCSRLSVHRGSSDGMAARVRLPWPQVTSQSVHSDHPSKRQLSASMVHEASMAWNGLHAARVTGTALSPPIGTRHLVGSLRKCTCPNPSVGTSNSMFAEELVVQDHNRSSAPPKVLRHMPGNAFGRIVPSGPTRMESSGVPQSSSFGCSGPPATSPRMSKHFVGSRDSLKRSSVSPNCALWAGSSTTAAFSVRSTRIGPVAAWLMSGSDPNVCVTASARSVPASISSSAALMPASSWGPLMSTTTRTDPGSVASLMSSGLTCIFAARLSLSFWRSFAFNLLSPSIRA